MIYNGLIDERPSTLVSSPDVTVTNYSVHCGQFKVLM